MMPTSPAGNTGGCRDDRPSALPLCGPEDLAMTVHWERDGAGLRGQVTARNIGARACRLAGKPAITPLTLDGTALPAQTLITLRCSIPVMWSFNLASAPRLRWAGAAGAGSRPPIASA
jgi:hypothetical protein